MKIAFISTGYFPTDSGGASISTRLIADELRERGAEVDVFTTTGVGKSARQVGSDHYEFPSGTAYRLPDRIGKNYGVFKHLADRTEYDLIHVYGLGSLPAAVIRADAPVLGTVNNLEWACINWTGYLRDGCPDYGLSEALRLAVEEGFRAMLPLKIGLESTGKLLSKQADEFTVQNEGMKTVMQRCGYPADKFTTVPNLLDPRFTVETSPTEKQLIYVGRLTPKKGIVDVVRAYCDLNSNLRDEWTFKIYGKGKSKAHIEAIAEDQDVDIEFDYCPYEELPEVYRRASVLIHASKYPEPFSRTWMEAMASETAIICSENPSSRAVLKGIAELYDPFDNDSLKCALTRVLSDPDRRSEMTTTGKQSVTQYEPDTVVSQYESIYQRLLS